MQPYLFPYLGYFQLIHAVDKFVVYDDVNYIKGGWINRNYILEQGISTRITLNTVGASPNVPINQIGVGNNKNKLLKTISQSYARAPEFASFFPIVEDILSQDEANLAIFVTYSLKAIAAYLGLTPEWIASSNLDKNNSLHGEDKVIDICRRLHADEYVNLPGGRSLYDPATFKSNGVRLLFIQNNSSTYHQFGDTFVPNLSIVDVAMFNSPEVCKKMVSDYSLGA